MGAFYIYKKSAKIDLEGVNRTFKELGFSNKRTIEINEFILCHYPKILFEEHNVCSNNNATIIGIGSFLYKGKIGKNGLSEILYDIKKSKFNKTCLFGNYALILLTNEIKIFLNSNNAYNIFYNSDKSFITSSFLAVMNSSFAKFTLDVNVLTEVILTGGNILPYTLTKEIRKVDSLKTNQIDNIKIDAVNGSSLKIDLKPLDSINNQLFKYFSSFKNLSKEFIFSTGITGGLDSRLIVSFLKKLNYKNVDLFTFTAGQSKIEKDIIEKIVEEANYNINFIENNPNSYNYDLDENLSKSFLFNDGIIRSQLYFHEIQNSGEFLMKSTGPNIISFHGVNGEQYRNGERINYPAYDFNNWLKYNILYHFSYPLFKRKSLESAFLNLFGKKIINQLGLSQQSRINREDVKRYYNSVYFESTRSHRASVENKYHYHFMPFGEYQHIQLAQSLFKEMGPSISFESELINMVSPKLAGINSNYGFPFSEKEPLKLKYAAYFKDYIPKSLFYKIYSYLKKYNQSKTYEKLLQESKFLKENEFLLDEIGLNLDIEKLKRNKYTSRLLPSVIYFLYSTQNKLKYEKSD